MLTLALANLMHQKLRTALSALAVGLGLTLFLVSKGLASGSIGEVADRMQSVQAQLMILPAQENTIYSGGAVFSRSWGNALTEVADEQGPLAQTVIPVFWGQVRMGGQQQRVFGINPEHMPLFLGPRRIIVGQAFDRAHAFSQRVAELRETTGRRIVTDQLTAADRADGAELVIDSRLRDVGTDGRPYELGDEVLIQGRTFRIVGVVERGVAGRVFAPIEALRDLLIAGDTRSSMFFIRLRDDVDPRAAANRFADTIGGTGQVHLTSDYGEQLQEDFAQVDMYMTATSGLALVVCFLFILLTMYTFVIERTREIGILKALGMTRTGLVLLSVTEALLISLAGVVISLGLSLAAKAFLAVRLPLLTVELPLARIGWAAVIGIVGGTLSALYPGYRAARLQPAVALSHE